MYLDLFLVFRFIFGSCSFIILGDVKGYILEELSFGDLGIKGKKFNILYLYNFFNLRVFCLYKDFLWMKGFKF